jgi:hypothetical protein
MLPIIIKRIGGEGNEATVNGSYHNDWSDIRVDLFTAIQRAG